LDSLMFLGYQNIIDNNKISDVARILSESFTRIPGEAEKKLLEKMRAGVIGARSCNIAFRRTALGMCY